MDRIKLFCFPHLGGSAAIYYQWRSLFPTSIEICPVELAGRGERNEEPFYQNFQELVSDVSEQIIHTSSEAYALFGHSMGTLIAYETTYYLMNRGIDPPIHIFFSGRNTPDIKNDMFINCMNDETFIEKLNQLGGIPSAIFDYPELVDMVLPVLKADYRVMNTYGFTLQKQKIKSNITVVAGDNDLSITYEDMRKWRLITEGDCSMHFIPGGHFYMENNLNALVGLIKTTLAKY